MIQFPALPPGWVFFADARDGILALLGALLILLLLIWWSQRTNKWPRIGLVTLLAAMILCTASFYLFVTPAYQAGCPQGCTGYRGYPLPIAKVTLENHSVIAPVDFLLNLLVLWLLWLVASVVWYLAAIAFSWERHSLRWRLRFVFILAILPWAVLPKALNPPQPEMVGEDLRIAINGRRAAEFTYRVTGPWVLRLALEDVKRISPQAIAEDSNPEVNQVCLRGYTWFFIPWRRYRVDLDPAGITPVRMAEMSLDEKCW